MHDETAIANLVFRYAELIDGGDYDGIGASVRRRGDHRGRFERRMARRRRDHRDVRQRHAPLRRRHAAEQARHSNLIIEVDDARAHATCRSYYTVLQQTDEVPLQPIVGGRYHDELARAVDGPWHFTHRHMFVDLVGDLSKHLLFEYRRPTQ